MASGLGVGAWGNVKGKVLGLRVSLWSLELKEPLFRVFPQTPNPQSLNPNPKPQTLNPKPHDGEARALQRPRKDQPTLACKGGGWRSLGV